MIDTRTGGGRAEAKARLSESAPSLKCVKCRYDLRGLARSAKCPECGLPIAESLDTIRQSLLRGVWRDGACHLLVILLAQALYPVVVMMASIAGFASEMGANRSAAIDIFNAVIYFARPEVYGPLMTAVLVVSILTAIWRSFRHKLSRFLIVLCVCLIFWFVCWWVSVFLLLFVGLSM